MSKLQQSFVITFDDEDVYHRFYKLAVNECGFSPLTWPAEILRQFLQDYEECAFLESDIPESPACPGCKLVTS